MRQRTSFSTSIVESNTFLSMNVETQNLYFHLVLHADIRGFCNNVKSLQKAYGGNVETLIKKKFLLQITDDIYLIKHWYVHNTFMDAYTESTYAKYLSMIYLDENNSYTTKKTDFNALAFLEGKTKGKGKTF